MSEDTKTQTAARCDGSTQSDVDVYTHRDVSAHTHAFTDIHIYGVFLSLSVTHIKNAAILTHQPSPHEHVHIANHSHVCASKCSTYTTVRISDNNQSAIEHLVTAPTFLPFAL